MTKLLSRLSNPLLLLMGIALAGGGVIIGISLYSSAKIDASVRKSSEETTAERVAADIRESIDSIYVLGLLARLDGAAAGHPDNPVITVERAIQGHDTMQLIVARAGELHALVASPETDEILRLSLRSQAQVEAFLSEPTTERLFGLIEELPKLRELTGQEATRLRVLAEDDDASLRDAVVLTRWSTTLAMMGIIVAMGAATMIIGGSLAEAARVALGEKTRLLETTSVLERRNHQFSALYQVMSEVSESLSMRYVVQTTIREAKNLVDADMVGLRRLDAGQLLLAGIKEGPGVDLGTLGPVPLGAGITGRVAKSGKTIRIDERASERMTEGERVPDVESGIVVPLIVGARVVGTLGCWSRTARHFSDDDVRILEMMASQVATAITAADLHAATEEEAMHDALTQLPNRRQLTEDIEQRLNEALTRGESVAIAMADIDYFKGFNDDHGHRVGDITLQKVATILRTSVRDQDRVYRFGGEEFLIVFAGAAVAEALQLAERLRSAVEQMPMTGELLQPVGPVTISIGVAAFPEHGATIEALIEASDLAMYASKAAGRNRVTLASTETDLSERPAA